MDATTFPFRESLQLTEKLQLTVWHDAKYIECHYQIQSFWIDKNDVKHVREIASFKYLAHFLKFMSENDITTF